jgi:D-sedoheptulose 7-phosphate isomerase
MLEQRVQQHFIDSADLKFQSAQPLSKPITAAVQAVMACVTSGCKVMVCGSGASASLAQHFVSGFVGQFERERPELAALALTADAAALTGAGDADMKQVFSRPVRALGQTGDVLMVLSCDGRSPSVLAAVEAAHERDMTVVALTGRTGGLLAAGLRETDVLVCVPHDRVARVHELHILVLHCICDGVDAQLLGEQEVPT